MPMWLRDWGDVMSSSAVAIGGCIAVKQMDEGARIAFILTSLDIDLKGVTRYLI